MTSLRRSAHPALLAGIVGPLLFVIVFLIEGALRAGYDPVRLQVSYLSLGDGGWIQIANFLVSGGLVVTFALGLRGVLLEGRGAAAAPIGVAMIGVGLIVAGLFSTVPAFGWPPATPDGFPTDIPATAYLHLGGALCFFLGMVVASLAMARRFRANGAGSWAGGSVAIALVVLGFLGASSADPTGRPFFPPVAGLLQRISIIAGLGWIAALAARTLRGDAGQH